MTPSAAADAAAKSKAAAAGRQLGRRHRRTKLLRLLASPLDACVTTFTSTLTPARHSSAKQSQRPVAQ